MRKLQKAQKPQVLVDNAENWRDELLLAIANQRPKVEIEKLSDRYADDEVRDALKLETFEKCAFCEGKMAAISYAQIEHLKPKSLYRELTFEWDNLSLACAACNTNKKAIDPTPGNFVHPYNDDPEQRFKFAGPLIYWLPGDVPAQNMINWLKLNRSGLLERRAKAVAAVQKIFDLASRIPEQQRAEYLAFALADYIEPGAEDSRAAQCIAEALTNELG